MLRVTCAIIRQYTKVLICQRSITMKLPLKWEFPGGKIEDGEMEEECLRREIKEELNIDITIGRALSMVEHHYPDFSIYLYPFECIIQSGIICPTEHAQVLWVECDQLPKYNWADADIPIVQEIMRMGK